MKINQSNQIELNTTNNNNQLKVFILILNHKLKFIQYSGDLYKYRI